MTSEKINLTRRKVLVLSGVGLVSLLTGCGGSTKTVNNYPPATTISPNSNSNANSNQAPSIASIDKTNTRLQSLMGQSSTDSVAVQMQARDTVIAYQNDIDAVIRPAFTGNDPNHNLSALKALTTTNKTSIIITVEIDPTDPSVTFDGQQTVHFAASAVHYNISADNEFASGAKDAEDFTDHGLVVRINKGFPGVNYYYDDIYQDNRTGDPTDRVERHTANLLVATPNYIEQGARFNKYSASEQRQALTGVIKILEAVQNGKIKLNADNTVTMNGQTSRTLTLSAKDVGVEIGFGKISGTISKTMSALPLSFNG